MNITPIIDAFYDNVQRHALPTPGQYARWLWEKRSDADTNDAAGRKMGNNEYGCADANNILYTIGRLPLDPAVRAASVKALQDFQQPDGLFFEGTHHAIHCTAHCSGALELFDARPARPYTALEQYKTKEGLYALLEGLNWTGSPWNNAHQGAGIYAAFANNDEATPAFTENYFNWLTENADPTYGIGIKGAIDTGKDAMCHHLYGWFHYLFNFSYAHKPFPYPEKLIDSCLAMYYANELGERFGKMTGFCEIDWVYSLNRAVMQTGYRFAEAKQALRGFAEKYFNYLLTLDYAHDELWNDLHAAFGAVCAVAELQLALPGEYPSDKPLKQILDRRPFI